MFGLEDSDKKIVSCFHYVNPRAGLYNFGLRIKFEQTW